MGAQVIINDRADIARLVHDGVHVGQTDLPIASVRSIVGPGAIVGLSTHDQRQIDEALAGDASYVAVGPVFPQQPRRLVTRRVAWISSGMPRAAANQSSPSVVSPSSDRSTSWLARPRSP